VRAPRLYYLQNLGHTVNQVHEDFPTGVDLTKILCGNQYCRSVIHRVFRETGTSLRAFHNWASAAESINVRRTMEENEHMRELKHSTSYQDLVSVMSRTHPDLVRECRAELRAVQEMAAQEFATAAEDLAGANWSVIHGDFWPGK
jgi:hypothetical protein